MILTLYHREGCSLCEALIEELEPFRRQWGFAVRAVDVDSSPALAERYGRLVPVLEGEAGEICRYYLDPERLERYLTAFRN